MSRAQPLWVAFFRNLNQGQRNSPSRLELIDSLIRSGATDVAPFQGNGTVVFVAEHPETCAGRATELLGAETTWNDVAFVRSLGWIAALVSTLRSEQDLDPRNLELSLFNPSSSVDGKLPILGRRCSVRSGGDGYAVTLNERPNESNATPTIERALGTPVTSRGLPTLLRLIERFGTDR